MKSKFFKLLMNGSVVVLGTITLSACSSSSSMYGIYGDGVSSNYDSNTFTSNFSNYSSYDSTDQETMSAYGTVFSYYFDNFAYSTSTTLYADNNGSNSFNSTSIAGSSWTYTIYYLLSYASNLCDLYNAGFKAASSDTLPSDLIITTDNSDLLKQFVYSWANVLSKGTTNLRFGIVGIQVKLSSYNLFPDEGTDLTVDTSTNDDGTTIWTTATYNPSVTFQIAFELGYWHATTNSQTQSLVTDTSDIDKMIKETNAWSKSDIDSVQYSKMYLVLNYTFTPTLTYTYTDITAVDPTYTYDTSSDNYSSDTIKTDSDGNSYITWSDTLVKNALPPSTFTFSGASVDNQTTTTLDTDSVTDSITDITNLLNSSTYNSKNVTDEQDKFKYSLTLQTDGILSDSDGAS